MDNYKTNFLDYPLDRDVHVCRPYVFEKRPIKILVTDGGHKFVFCLLYKICSGEVFGNDQDVIIHLICSKGVIDQKSIFYELEECGFHLLKGWLVTSDIEEAYTDVDIVVFTTSYEEQSGVTHKETLLNHIIKARQTTKYVLTYAKSDVKIIFVGASTKFVLLEMGLLRRLEPTLKYRNVSGVTLLDEAIARAHLAAKLKTTTDRIKNIIIWGQTCPDVHYATVRMLPKGDLGATEEVEVPVHEALQDDRYLHETFIECILRRKVGYELSRSGKGVAIAIARHLKALFGGQEDEIISMAVITPPSEPYSMIANTVSSYPVWLKGNGTWKVREDMKYGVATHLTMIKLMHHLRKDKPLGTLFSMMEWILKYEKEHNEMITIKEKPQLLEIFELPRWDMDYVLVELPLEAIPKVDKENFVLTKSIAWDDTQNIRKEKKSSIRFILDGSKKFRKKSSMAASSKGSISLPSIIKKRMASLASSNALLQKMPH
ncbi:UNVERIFIED_CONTAM: hypothetical protein PYX00_000185 [Menopon gallinae]|uniref:Lactate/malate dehydrogenase C-terminal domain-containing protein n=1 Tax=Menopon gallinae TaxID=328185 RepID=A0AAW2I9I5_9NEOP